MTDYNLPLLHGSLGWADEIIFVSVAIVFLALMAVQWVRMRAENPPEPPRKPDQSRSDADSDTFRLD
jgi:hypothetical protein